MSTIDEFLGPAEYVLSQGNRDVVLCERGPRAAEAARILMHAGRSQVSYIGGGRQLRQQDA